MVTMESAAAAIGLLEVTIRMVSRLQKAYARVKDAPKVLGKYTEELKGIKSVIEVVLDEESLQTANVFAEVGKIKDIEKQLQEGLKTAEKNVLEISSRKTISQVGVQFFRGSVDEKNLSGLIEKLSDVKATLCLYIQCSAVGVIRDMENRFVAKLETIEHVHNALVEALGRSSGLRIKNLIAGKTPREDGTIILSREEFASLNGFSNDSSSTERPKTERVIIGNLTKDQAVMINGPIDEDLWEHICRVEIRDNQASGQSVMINWHTDQKSLNYVRDWQRAIFETEQKARIALQRINSGDSGVGLSDSE